MCSAVALSVAVTASAQEKPPRAVSDATRPAAITAPDAATANLAAIDEVLARYREAFNNVDARAVKAVWPSVDDRDLARAFRQVRRQEVTFDDCQTSIQSETDARVTCRGAIRYVPRVGTRTDRVELRRWTFLLMRAGTDWRILTVEGRAQ